MAGSKKAFPYFLVLALLAGASFLSYFRVLETFELQTFDWRCRLRGPRPVSDKIVLIEISSDTLQVFGWPINREVYALLINALSDARASVIAFDVLFAEPNAADPAVSAMARTAKNVYFPVAFSSPEFLERRFISDEINTALLLSYRQAAKGVGFSNSVVDLDGKQRKAYPVIYYQGKKNFPIGLKVAADYLGISEEKIYEESGKSLHFSDQLRLPLDEDGYFIVNYAARWEEMPPVGFCRYSLKDILKAYQMKQDNSPEEPPVRLNDFAGKICVIGMTATGCSDLKPISLERVYPMMGQHANVINSILQKDFIRRLGRLANVVILNLGILLVSLFSLRARPARGLLGLLGVTFVFIGAAVAVFIRWGIWMDLFCPVMVFWATHTLMTVPGWTEVSN
jgi:adenylate cyclase